jgi:hypothetical protein
MVLGKGDSQRTANMQGVRDCRRFSARRPGTRSRNRLLGNRIMRIGTEKSACRKRSPHLAFRADYGQTGRKRLLPGSPLQGCREACASLPTNLPCPRLSRTTPAAHDEARQLYPTEWIAHSLTFAILPPRAGNSKMSQYEGRHSAIRKAGIARHPRAVRTE